MASKELLDAYDLIIKALAEKSNVSTDQVRSILANLTNQELTRLDWKDLDATIQEGLIDQRSGMTPGWEQKIQYDLGHRHPSQITASQEEYEEPPPSQQRRRMF